MQNLRHSLLSVKPSQSSVNTWGLFENILSVIKQMVTADREGNWPLHIAAVRGSMEIFTAFDCINYLKYAPGYLVQRHR